MTMLTSILLSYLTEKQTLVMYSGHPMGLFPSAPGSPRCVITNGMVIPNYSKLDDYERMYALGVTMYGQMTAGSYCYIGPQGIVHGTTITVMNAGRKYLGVNDLSGKVCTRTLPTEKVNPKFIQNLLEFERIKAIWENVSESFKMIFQIS